MYDFVEIISDIMQLPLFHALLVIFTLSMTLSISLQLFRSMCGISHRRRPAVVSDQVRKQLETSAKVSREILNAESPGIIEGCADCPLFRASGLRDEQCKLHGTAFCCVGRKLTEKGGVNYE